MQDYNEEYYFLRSKGNNYPLADYVNWTDSDIDYLEEKFEEDRVIPFVFSNPLPDKPKMADLHSSAGKLLISNKIKDQLSNMELNDIQFIPSTIKDQESQIHNEYYILHIYNLIEAMDLDKSDWQKDMDDPEMVYDINNLVLDNEKLKMIPLEKRLVFALQEHPLTTVYHRSVAEKILALNPTGLAFYQLSTYDPSKPFQVAYLDHLFNDEN